VELLTDLLDYLFSCGRLGCFHENSRLVGVTNGKEFEELIRSGNPEKLVSG